MKALLWIIVGAVLGPAVVLAILWATTDKSQRPAALPEDRSASIPWGAVDVQDARARAQPVYRLAVDAMLQGRARVAAADGGDVPKYSFLVLSGGGSNSAFGAGFLAGWSKSGTRPEFHVVTGISAGSLQASFAFLGSEYDDQLKQICTAHETSEIWTKKPPTAAIFQESMFDTTPLRGLIDHYATDEILAKVAARHEAGHRLYVGTTNMDTAEFVIWNMGKIAASGRPGARELYCDILLASCSVPVIYPPVYLPVERDGETFYEMHADGGVRRQIFFHGFLANVERVLADARAGPVEGEIFIVRNGKLKDPGARRTVAPRATALASRTIETLFEVTMQTQLQRLYVVMTNAGIDFNVAAIPDTFPDHDPTQFDRATMLELYDVGYRIAAEGYDWLKVPAGLDPFEQDLSQMTGAEPGGGP